MSINFNAGVIRDGFIRPDDEEDSEPELNLCPRCDHYETIEHIRRCIGFKSSEPKLIGHSVECICDECHQEERAVK